MLKKIKDSVLKVVQGVEIKNNGKTVKEVRGIITGIHINYLLVTLIAVTIIF